MTQEEINSGNKLIAEFMQMFSVYSAKQQVGWERDGEIIILGEYKPHEDWNELMPVVEKIEKMCYKFDIIGDYQFARHPEIRINGVGKGDFSGTFKHHEIITKIEAVYLAVIEFIKWHNANKK